MKCARALFGLDHFSSSESAVAFLHFILYSLSRVHVGRQLNLALRFVVILEYVTTHR